MLWPCRLSWLILRFSTLTWQSSQTAWITSALKHQSSSSSFSHSQFSRSLILFYPVLFDLPSICPRWLPLPVRSPDPVTCLPSCSSSAPVCTVYRCQFSESLPDGLCCQLSCHCILAIPDTWTCLPAPCWYLFLALSWCQHPPAILPLPLCLPNWPPAHELLPFLTLRLSDLPFGVIIFYIYIGDH